MNPAAPVQPQHRGRAASNAAIAGRDAPGYAASKLPTYRGTWAGILTHHSRDSAQVAMARQFADTVLLGYVRTPITVEVSRSGLSARTLGRIDECRQRLRRSVPPEPGKPPLPR